MAGDLGPAWHVIEEGHPGRTSVHDDPIEGAHKNAMRILPALLETHCPLDLVIIMLGTNDLKARFRVPASDIALSCERLIGEIRRSTAGPDQRAPSILLVAPAPIKEVGILCEMFAGGSEKSQRLSHELADVAERNAADFLDAGTVAEVDLQDGIHLTVRSHETLGHAIAQTVREIFGEAEAAT
jgi:lysophospholipase L1-like esterase